MSPSNMVTKRDIVQALAETNPWVYDEKLQAQCFFCNVARKTVGKTPPEAHEGSCLWVQAVRYRKRTKR